MGNTVCSAQITHSVERAAGIEPTPQPWRLRSAVELRPQGYLQQFGALPATFLSDILISDQAANAALGLTRSRSNAGRYRKKPGPKGEAPMIRAVLRTPSRPF